jgi:hypothetical protein
MTTKPKHRPDDLAIWENVPWINIPRSERDKLVRQQLFGERKADAPAQTLTEEEKKLALAAYENEARQRAAMYTDAAKRAAEAAKVLDSDPDQVAAAQAEIDRILANFDQSELLSEIEAQNKKNKAINGEKAFHKIALTIQEVFDETQLDEAQRRQLLTRLFAVFTKPQLVVPQQAPERYADRADRSERAVAFIRRVYQPWLGQGLTQAHINHIDKQLYMALHNWLRHNDMPADLSLPTKSEFVTGELADAGLLNPEGRRLAGVAHSRAMQQNRHS